MDGIWCWRSEDIADDVCSLQSFCRKSHEMGVLSISVRGSKSFSPMSLNMLSNDVLWRVKGKLPSKHLYNLIFPLVI